jgi:hypothetical protein
MAALRGASVLFALAASSLGVRAGAEPKASPKDMAARLFAVPGFERGYRSGIEDSRVRLRGAFDLGEGSEACTAAEAVQREHREALDRLLERATGREAAEASFARTFAALPDRTRSRVAAVLASGEFAAWFDAPPVEGASFLGALAAALAAADRRERWSRAGVLDDMVATGDALKVGLADVAARANVSLKKEGTALRARNGARALAALDSCIAEEDRRLGNRN